MPLTLYTLSGSPYAWRVGLALEHKGVAYDGIRLHFDRDEHKSAEFLKVNPRGKVPAIVHDGFALAESGAILEYLEEAWPERPLLPKEAKARGRVRQLAREAGEYLNEATNDVTRLAFGRPKADAADQDALSCFPLSVRRAGQVHLCGSPSGIVLCQLRRFYAQQSEPLRAATGSL